MSTQINPIQVAQGASGTSPPQPQAVPLNPYLAQAQQSFLNPAASPVPQANPIAGLANNPFVKSILDAVASAASAYGWTSMPPQQRVDAQNLEAQKAQAMARLGQAQRQLGYEGQRVGFEGQRAATDVKRSTAEATRVNVEAGEAPKRTAIQQQGVDIEKQRADQAYETEKKRLQIEADKAAAEYGPGGLRQGKLAQGNPKRRQKSTR